MIDGFGLNFMATLLDAAASEEPDRKGFLLVYDAEQKTLSGPIEEQEDAL